MNQKQTLLRGFIALLLAAILLLPFVFKPSGLWTVSGEGHQYRTA